MSETKREVKGRREGRREGEERGARERKENSRWDGGSCLGGRLRI